MVPGLPKTCLLLLALTLYGVGLPRHVHMLAEHGVASASECGTHACHESPKAQPAEQPVPADHHADDDCPDCQMLASAKALLTSSVGNEWGSTPSELGAGRPAQQAGMRVEISALGPRGPPMGA